MQKKDGFEAVLLLRLVGFTSLPASQFKPRHLLTENCVLQC
jgi:hypothetical protein